LAGWTKIEPIQQASLEGIRLGPRWDPATLAACLATFPIDRIWTCAYASRQGKASVVFFETPGPLDAFGLFSVLTQKPGVTARPEDGTMLESRVSDDTVDVIGWQGKVCVFVRASGFGDAERLPSTERLARRILFSIPWADPPLIMRAMPRTMLADSKIRMVRRTRALRIATEELRHVAEAELDDVLGLTGRELLWIAAIEKPADTQAAPERGNSSRNIVWIAEYPDIQSTRRAFDRYQRRLTEPTTDLDRRTEVRAPHGRYVIGTWTAGAEKAAPVLPALLDMLPTDDVATRRSANARSAGNTH